MTRRRSRRPRLPPSSSRPAKRFAPLPASAGRPDLDQLLARIREFPEPLHNMLFAGVKHLTDFQDPAYAGEYLDRVAKLYELDRSARRRRQVVRADRRRRQISRRRDGL